MEKPSPSKNMLYIENEGALFRGPARGLPKEVWSSQERRFVLYALAGQIKPIEWGLIIDEDEDEARRMMI